MTFAEAIKRYETHLRLERNLAPRTIKAYLYELNRLAQSLRASYDAVDMSFPLSRVTTDDLRTHLVELQLEGVQASSTISRTISSFKGFFRFCLEQGYVENDPATLIRSPKRPKHLPTYLVRDEVMKLLSPREDANWLARRDLAILTTLVFTGVRLQELVGLDLKDVSLENHTMRVMGKGRKERLIPLNEIVVARLSEYLDLRPRSDTDAIFLNRFLKRLHGRSVERMVRQAVINAGILQDKITPHKLRHTFATLLHMKDVDILEIQALLGHANISSTQIYTHTNAGRLRSAVDRLADLSEES